MPGRILVDTTPLRESRDFRLLFTGQLVSVIGTQLTVVAIPYQVYSMTHSTLQVGAISLAQLIPFLFGALSAGPIGDAVDKRRIMIWTAAAMMLTSGAMAVNAAVAHPSLVVLYVVSSLAAGLMGFSNTARMAAVPSMVERRHFAAAAAMTQIVFQLGVIVGPALSGLLLGIGLPLVYALDAASFVVATITSAMLRPIPPHEGARGLSPWESTKEGLRYLRSRQALQGVYLIDINAMVFGMPRALFPAMAASVFGGGTIALGFLYAAPGVGALIGAVTTGWVANLRRQGWAVIVAVCVWGAAIAVFGLVDTLWVGLVLLAVAGWADVISAVLRNTILQTSIPERFRSRMSSIQMAVVQGGPRVGDMESGAVATLTSVEFSVISGGLACIVGAAVIGALMPVFRHHVAGEIDDVPV
ncbi:MAG: MFS transporter [Acidimicrobiales bacterium]|jgi:MFS family permease